jgi:ELWxxDGT repeat protein
VHIPSREPFPKALAELWVTGDGPVFPENDPRSIAPKTSRLTADASAAEAAPTVGPATTQTSAAGSTLTVFVAEDGMHGSDLWVTDGTAEGTALIADIRVVSYYFTPLDNGTALFSGFDDRTNGSELWVTDGTAAGTMMVKNINPGSSSSYPEHITALGDGTAVFLRR